MDSSLRVLITVLCLVTLPAWDRAQPADWWVNFGSGSDSANGNSKATAWRTLKAARSNTGINPGDTIYLVGGTYNASQYFSGINDFPLWTDAHRKGTPGNPITIRPEPGTTVILDGENVNGLWLSFNPNAAAAYYIIVRDLEFRHWKGGAISIGNSAVGAGSTAVASNIAIIGCYIHDMYQGGAASLGTTVADRILFSRNAIIHIGDPAFGAPGAADHAYYLSHGSSNVVIERAYNEKIGGFGMHLWADFTAGWTTSNVIIRTSTTVNANHSGLIVAGSTYNKIYIYHNTLYSEAATYPEIQAATGIVSTQAAISFHNGGTYSNIRVKNNLSYGFIDAGTGLLWADAGFAPTGLELDYNWWTFAGGGGAMYRWLGTAYTSPAAFQAATVYGDHDLTGNPLFVNPAAGTRNFALQTTPTPSPAIDTGTTLTTTTTTAASPSTTLAVADAGYFHDGFGLGPQVPGDTIQVGSPAVNAPVLITGINYATNTLTLQTPLTWTAGQPVSLAYNGSAPDMGALESGSATPLPAPTNLRLISLTP